VHNESRKDVEWGLAIGIVLGLAFTALPGLRVLGLIAHEHFFGEDKFYSTSSWRRASTAST
jgi:cytochrome c oxidase subunit 3